MTSRVLPRAAARGRRVDLRVLIGLVAVLAGVLGTAGVVRHLAAHTPVLVMTRSVQAGATIGAADLRVAELGLTPGVAVLGPDARDRVVGQVAVVPLAAGQVLAAQQVTQNAPVGGDQVVMSVALPPEQAAGGMVQAGDQVELIATPRSAVGDGRAQVLLGSVRVLAVSPSADPSGGGKLVISLAVPRPSAPQVAQAAAGRVDLAVLGRQGGG